MKKLKTEKTEKQKFYTKIKVHACTKETQTIQNKKVYLVLVPSPLGPHQSTKRKTTI